MPRSRTPVVSFDLAKTILGLLPSGKDRSRRLSSPIAREVIITTMTPISGFNSAACILALLSSRLPLPVLPVRLTTNLLAKL
ncbi:MAG: hypothetical protein WA705_12635 [Candidatus Ozemobacteraceae bacterium]